LAQITGFLSQVPGGLGVLETVFVLLLSPLLPASDVLGAVLAFRICYYIIPFILGLISFAIYEIVRNKAGFKRALQILNHWAPDFAPHVFAVLIFLSGALLFFSNATPENIEPMTRLSKLVPLPVLESSHFLVGLAGAGLLILARGLQQRLEGVYVLTLVVLGVGVLGCLFKGFDYQEALTLLVMWGLLLPARRYFPRKSSLFQQPYPPLWVTAILFVWLGSIWIGIFNYRYEDYTGDLWTTFDLGEDASRFLRSTFGATLTLVVFSIINLLTPAQPETEIPTPSELAKGLEVAKNSRRSYAYFALLGDKALLFNRKSDAFLMYAIEGKSWITLGDPVGSQKEQQELAVKFNDLCRRKKSWALFLQVDQDHFQFYLDMGLTVMKIGEEARVSLKALTLESLASADLKNTYQRFKETEDYTFKVIPAGEWGPLTAELKKSSEEWLSKNKTREKGFLTGFFNEKYLRHFPLAVVLKEGKVAAFSNLQLSSGKEEVSVDLLRSSAEANPHLEDYLLLEVMLWSKEKGYKWFNLGTAPLLDADESPLAPFKDQMKEILSPYGNPVQLLDIRKAKERFNPEWAPKYLAGSGNISLTVAFNNIRSLISKIPHVQR
jgi:phosphatidylglycerol lysyltransferase